MIALGLDISTKTGLGIWDTDRHESAIVAKTLKVADGTQWERGVLLQGMIRAEMVQLSELPRAAFIELPQQRAEPSVQITILLNILASAAYRALRICGMEERSIEFVSDSTWRKALYGFGRKKGWATPDWKRHAKETCAQMGISVANQDEAEGALLAFYAGRTRKFDKYKQAMELAL